MANSTQEPIILMRRRLLKLCTAKKLSAKQILQIVEPMRDKSDEEKEKIAARLIVEVEKM